MARQSIELVILNKKVVDVYLDNAIDNIRIYPKIEFRPADAELRKKSIALETKHNG